jgi:hypothetical protein
LTDILCNIGNKNAAVLPVPVAAQPIKSEPLKMAGIARCWIGVGSVNPMDAHLVASAASNPSSVKIIIFLPARRRIAIVARLTFITNKTPPAIRRTAGGVLCYRVLFVEKLILVAIAAPAAKSSTTPAAPAATSTAAAATLTRSGFVHG